MITSVEVQGGGDNLMLVGQEEGGGLWLVVWEVDGDWEVGGADERGIGV